MVITTFQNRKSSLGSRLETSWEEFVDRLKTAEITEETLDEYRGMTNEQRTEIKDVGGYVAGEFFNNRRSKNNLVSRCILAVDADSATSHDVEDYEAMYDYVYFCHTTHTSTPESPRYRWLFPLSRPVTSSEYRLLVSEVKLWVGADTIDESTDQPERLMFWPSVCLDADYYYWEGGTSLLNPDDFITAIPDTPAEPEEPSTPIVVTDTIPEGQRNAALFSFAASLRTQGLDKVLIRNFLTAYNEAYCEVPLPDSELDTITWSVCKYDKGEKIPFSARDAKLDFGDLGEFKRPERKYHLERMSDILKEDIPAPKFLIKDILPMGLGALTAPPKFGKSWMCLDIAVSVATGTDFLGFPTTKSEVIYLALEDGKFRLKDRTIKVGGDSVRLDDLDGLYVSREAPTMTHGSLLEWLQDEVRDKPKVKLVIIDTLQKIRGESKKNEGVYGYDYRELGEIQKFAIQNGLCILLIHHTKKGINDSDFLENLSGSNGVSGALDFSLVLSRKRRKDDTTLLDITGRDIPMQSYVIQMDSVTYRWQNLGEEKDLRETESDRIYSADPLVKTINWYLDLAEETAEDEQTEAVWAVSSQEILNAIFSKFGNTEYDSTVVIGRRITSLTRDLAAKDGILYEPARSYRDGKRIRLHTFKRSIVS